MAVINTYRLLALTLLFCILAGCSSLSSFQSPNPIKFTYSADQYLQLAASAPPQQKLEYQLLAVERLLQNRTFDRAQQVLDNSYTQYATQELFNKKQLLQAQLYLLTDRTGAAASILNNLQQTANMTPANQILFHQLMAELNLADNDIIASVNQRITLDPLLSSTVEKEQNRLLLWESLQRLNLQSIKALLNQPNTSDLAGWLELAVIAQEPTSTSNQFLTALQNWRAQFPNHPANSILPSSFTAANNAVIHTPQQVALLLPLQGQLASTAEAIRNGFMAAYYQNPNNQTIKISVYDTSHGDIRLIYKQAIANGADFVIGPLTKENVQTLADSNALTVPTLALNTLDNYQHLQIHHLYQFGLSPRDSAVQVADKAWQDNHSRSIVIAPQSSWGQGIAQAFSDEWQKLGGTIAINLAYPDSPDISAQIQAALNIDQSEQRAQALQKILGEKFRFIPRRRNDVDVIFLAALPQRARQIGPLLKFYYAGNIPVYATSLIYSGNPSPRYDRDLDGIQFCDVPWVLDNNNDLTQNLQSLHQQIMTTWPNSYKQYPRLYALGVDAFGLMSRFNQLLIFPKLGLSGATGTLYLDPYRHIVQKLVWAQMDDGKPRLMR